MKIDLTAIDPEQFLIQEKELFGEKVFLIQPQHIGTKWTQENKHLRSCLTDSEGNIISLGFPKFTNWGENPEHFPVPTDLSGAEVMEKLDGSLLIVSKWKGNYILRTRGTVDARQLDNGHEIEIFLARHKNYLDSFPEKEWNGSFLFEWLSPVNKIVLDYGEVDFRLIGRVWHWKARLSEQYKVAALARNGGMKSPTIFNFKSIPELLKGVDEWKGKEGVVVYTQRGQVLHKVKSAWYLVLHRMKSELSSLEKVVDVWLERGRPSELEFYKFIEETFDFELAEQVKDKIQKICKVGGELDTFLANAAEFVNSIRNLSRKEAALAITKKENPAFYFTLLDNKQIDNKMMKKFVMARVDKGVV